VSGPPASAREVYRSRTMVVFFDMDRQGIRRIAVGPELRAACLAVVNAARPYAESISPVETGQYARSFSIAMGHTWVAAMRRVAARLVNTDPAAAAIEFGTSHGGPAHRVLQRTLAHINGGLRVPGVGRANATLGLPRLRVDVRLEPIPSLPAFRHQRERMARRQRRRGRARPS
jgi:hypothetical protein